MAWRQLGLTVQQGSRQRVGSSQPRAAWPSDVSSSQTASRGPGRLPALVSLIFGGGRVLPETEVADGVEIFRCSLRPRGRQLAECLITITSPNLFAADKIGMTSSLILNKCHQTVSQSI